VGGPRCVSPQQIIRAHVQDLGNRFDARGTRVDAPLFNLIQGVAANPDAARQFDLLHAVADAR
jgi:hypothetical protein